RQEALRFLGRYRDVPDRFHEPAWEVVKERDRPVAAYRRAKGWVETALRLEPKSQTYAVTQGVAEYRLGEYPATVNSLLRANRMYRQDVLHQEAVSLFAGPWALAGHNVWLLDDPQALAFLAMAYHRLGQQDDARQTLSRLRALLLKSVYSE